MIFSSGGVPLLTGSCCGAPMDLFADYGDEDFSPVRRAAMFEQKNPLPGTELHFVVHDRHGLAGTRQHHSDM